MMRDDPTVDQPGLFFFAFAILVAVIAGFGWLQGQNVQLVDELFLIGSWAISLDKVVGFSFKNGFVVYPRWKKSPYVRKFLIPLSVVATVLYLIGNFVISPILGAK